MVSEGVEGGPAEQGGQTKKAVRTFMDAAQKDMKNIARDSGSWAALKSVCEWREPESASPLSGGWWPKDGYGKSRTGKTRSTTAWDSQDAMYFKKVVDHINQVGRAHFSFI